MENMFQRFSDLLDQKLKAALDQRLAPLETAFKQKEAKESTDAGGGSSQARTTKQEQMDAMGGAKLGAGASGATSSELGSQGGGTGAQEAGGTSKADASRGGTSARGGDNVLSTLMGAGSTPQALRLKQAAAGKAREVFPEGRYFNDAPVGESNLVPTEGIWAELREHYQEATVEHDEAANPYQRPLKERQGVDLPHVWHMRTMSGDTGEAVAEARRGKRPQTAEEIEGLHAACSYIADLLIAWKEAILITMSEAAHEGGGTATDSNQDDVLSLPHVMEVADRWLPLYNIAAHTQNLLSKRLEVVASSMLELVDDATPEEKAFGKLLRSRGKIKRGLFTGSSMQAQREFHVLATQASMKSAAQRTAGGQDESRGGRGGAAGGRGDDDRLKRENATLRRQIEQLRAVNPSSSNQGDGKPAKERKPASPGAP